MVEQLAGAGGLVVAFRGFLALFGVVADFLGLLFSSPVYLAGLQCTSLHFGS